MGTIENLMGTPKTNLQTSHSQEIELLASQSLSPFFHHQNIFIAKSAADSEMNAFSCKKQMHVISSKLQLGALQIQEIL